jgi:hypothetical protein
MFDPNDLERYDRSREYFGPPKQWKAQRWEYQTVFLYQKGDTKLWSTASGYTRKMIVEILDSNGKDGWELVRFDHIPRENKHHKSRCGGHQALALF